MTVACSTTTCSDNGMLVQRCWSGSDLRKVKSLLRQETTGGPDLEPGLTGQVVAESIHGVKHDHRVVEADPLEVCVAAGPSKAS